MRGLVLVLTLVGACGGEQPAAQHAPPVIAVVLDAGVTLEAAVLPDATEAGEDGITQAPPCEPVDAEPAAAPHDTLTLTRVGFADLPGWADDRHAEVLPALRASCTKLDALKPTAAVGHDGHGGTARQWRALCAAARKVPVGDHAAARTMLERELVPWQAAGDAGPDGKLTGYFVQELRASRTKRGKYQYPIYARPPDLVMVDLSKHIKDARGRRIWGRLDAKSELVPYATRAEIRRGALAGKGLELMYADDPVDLLFAHIEGSAKAKLDDGSEVWLEFSGKNGRAYRGVGGVLKSMGELQAPGSGTMPGIRAWFAAHPGTFDAVVDRSHSFVFFQASTRPGAVGSQMVILTPRRSMAVDRAFIAHGTPIWVQTRVPQPGKAGAVPWTQLLVAQDTGGGILGAVRGDIFWGDDAEAADLGGRMGGKGRYWLLLPKGVTK